MSDVLPTLTPVPCLTIGRKKTTHRAKVLIEDGRVIVRTRCGLSADTTESGFGETFGIPTCDGCEAAS